MRRTAPAGLSSRPRAPAARRARVRSIFGCLRVDPNSRGFSGFFGVFRGHFKGGQKMARTIRTHEVRREACCWCTRVCKGRRR